MGWTPYYYDDTGLKLYFVSISKESGESHGKNRNVSLS